MHLKYGEESVLGESKLKYEVERGAVELRYWTAAGTGKWLKKAAKTEKDGTRN